MGHLGEGDLRAYVDGELAPGRRAAADRHLASCAACRTALSAIASDADWSAGALASYGRAAESGVAPGTWDAEPAAPASGAPRVRAPRWRPAARSLAAGVAAAAVVALVAVPSVRAAAGDFLQIFRVQRLQVVNLTPADLAQIRSALSSSRAGLDIRGMATVQFVPPSAQPIATTVAEAGRTVGFPVTVPAPAPAGYTLASTTLAPRRVVRVQLNAAGIDALLARLGSADRVPASLNGKAVTLTIPSVVTLSYASASGAAPIRILETQTPELSVPAGVDPGSLRQILLDLPFLPADVRQQLAAIQNWQDTAVVPEVAGVSQAVTVGGAQGVFIQAPSAGGPDGLIWIAGQVVRGIEGPLTLAQAQAIAASMR